MHLIKALSLTCVLASASALQADMTITFNLAGFGNTEGIPTNGMNFAIVADTGGDGFALGEYLAFDITANSQFLPTGGGLSDDLFLFGINGLTSTVFAPPLSSNGAIGSIVNVPYDSLTLSPGMEFGLIWFDSNAANEGDYYGFVRGIDWVLGSDGDAISGLESVVPGAAGYMIIPEPGTYALAFGAGALLWASFRRRRA
ncbi:MAG: PEP-CTERM sorting domain-containing protein [Verrucomicrobiota bacterium JB022]|nr:PEP-CTERM sorting domain-containing protein [Verrucomicrobiota bacterium JB022]